MVKKVVEVVASFSQKGLKTFQKNINGWNASMSAPLSRMKEVQTAQGGWNKRTKEGSTSMGRAALGIRKATHGMRGFRMEMLGLMFFGMSMQRMFGGLMKTALEWTGIMDLLSMTLGVVFLPVAMQLMELFIPIATWFMNLSDNTKLWIGWIVILGFTIGTIIMIIGQLALGIGSLILVFGGVTFAGILTGLASLFLSLVAVLGLIFVMKGAFGGFDEAFDDSVSKWQQNGGKFAKIVGGMVRILHLGGAIMSATLLNAISLIIIAFHQMSKGVNIAITWIINKLIDAWNWFKKVKAMGGSYTKTAHMASTSGIFDQKIAAETKKIVDRSLPLLQDTPTLGDLFTGGPVIPETPDDNRTNAEKRGDSVETNVTNNFNGFTMEELLKELDTRDSMLASQMERDR